jgi:DNA processing protein
MFDRFPESERTLASWLTLRRTPGIGSIRFLNLLDQFQQPLAVFDAVACRTPLGLPGDTLTALRNPDWTGVDADLAWLREDASRHILTLNDPRYPHLLKEISDPPPLLFVIGNPDLLQQPQLAIVGSRNPSVDGRENAHAFARALVNQQLVITSGLALGIDAAAHQGALAGDGPTIAITGTGLDRVYPARHRALAREITLRGALISEFPIGTPALAENFPRRNRIISGLSLGTLVIEAAPQSGSLITARLAAEQGREVFAIPGSIHNPLARGCHQLIRQGAKLVESVADILEEIHVNYAPIARATTDSAQHAPDLDDNSLILWSNLGSTPASVDTLVTRTQLTTEEVSSILLLMELQGWVTSAAGGMYLRVNK